MGCGIREKLALSCSVSIPMLGGEIVQTSRKAGSIRQADFLAAISLAKLSPLAESLVMADALADKQQTENVIAAIAGHFTGYGLDSERLACLVLVNLIWFNNCHKCARTGRTGLNKETECDHCAGAGHVYLSQAKEAEFLGISRHQWRHKDRLRSEVERVRRVLSSELGRAYRLIGDAVS